MALTWVKRHRSCGVCLCPTRWATTSPVDASQCGASHQWCNK